MTVTDTQRNVAAGRGKKLGLLHIPYVHGGYTERSIDCSGLTMVAWKAAGIELPHNAALQAGWFDRRKRLVVWNSTNRPRLKPGDVLFYQGSGGTARDMVGHCGLFIENFQGVYVVAQATDEQHGTELIRAQKYENVLYIGFMR